MAENESDDSGPAFPGAYWATPYSLLEYRSGMTFRDWLAGQALVGLTANSKTNSDPLETASDAYLLAEAMLIARAQNNLE